MSSQSNASAEQVMIDIDGQHEWRDCLDIPGVRLPQGYYFGATAVTGDLSGKRLKQIWQQLFIPLTLEKMKYYDFYVWMIHRQIDLSKYLFIFSDYTFKHELLLDYIKISALH